MVNYRDYIPQDMGSKRGYDGEISGKICLECGWSVRADEIDSIEEGSERALEHFLETGHAIESIDQFAVLEVNG